MQPKHNKLSSLVRRDLSGGSRQLLFIGMVTVLVALAYVADRMSRSFPLLDPDPTASFVIAGVVVVLASVWIARFRSKLVPFETPRLMWATVVALACCAGGLSWFLLELANWSLDRAPPQEVRYTILGRYSFDGDFFFRTAPESIAGEEGQRTYSVSVTEEDWDAARTGSVLLLDLRPGFLGFRWIAGYRVCETKYRRC